MAGGGTRPFGFEADFVTVRESEAEVIRELAERLIGGETLRSLCKDLNERGHRYADRSPVEPHSSAPDAALRAHQRPARAPRRNCGAARSGPRSSRPNRPDASGRSSTTPPDAQRVPPGPTCCGGSCGARCAGRRSSPVPGATASGATSALAAPGSRARAACTRWRSLWRSSWSRQCCGELDSPELAKAIRGNGHRPVTDWDRQSDGAQARLDELAGAYAGGAISMREWLLAREPIQQQLDVARRRSAQNGQVTVLADYVGRSGALRRRWPELGFDRQRAILAAVLVEVLVRPGRRGFNRFDPSRFELVWRY